MRRISKTDNNQARIVDALRKIGVTVKSLHIVGDGCPDLLCAIAGHNFLIEVKNNKKSKLTPDQVIFHQGWNSVIYIITSANEAVIIALRYKKLQKLYQDLTKDTV